jgi:SAM-dependent methyltransferase
MGPAYVSLFAMANPLFIQDPYDLQPESGPQVSSDTAIRKAPWRARFFDAFVDEFAGVGRPSLRILEVGAGPGFLADHVLAQCPLVAEYTVLEPSEPLIGLCRERLKGDRRVRFVCGEIAEWQHSQALGAPFDIVLSTQAAHDVRHRGRSPQIFEQIRALLDPDGLLLVSDHVRPKTLRPAGAPRSSLDVDQIGLLLAAGFGDARICFALNGMVLYRARRRT